MNTSRCFILVAMANLVSCLVAPVALRADERVISADKKFIFVGQGQTVSKYKNVPNFDAPKSNNVLWSLRLDSDVATIAVSQAHVVALSQKYLYAMEERTGRVLKKEATDLRQFTLAGEGTYLTARAKGKEVFFAVPSLRKIDGPILDNKQQGHDLFFIVAPDQFHDALADYVKHKKKHLPTELVSLETVLKTSKGVDDPE